MDRPLQFLIAEDSAADAELLARKLRQAGLDFTWRRVDSATDFVAGLHAGIDLIISDYEMPGFSGLEALRLAQELFPDIPFVLVSGTIGEENAVQAMRQGAADYLLKDRLARLGPAISRVLEESSLRRERQKREAALREADAQLNHLVARSPTVIYSLRLTEGGFIPTYVSLNAASLSGFSMQEMLSPGWWTSRVHPDDLVTAQAGREKARTEGASRVEYRLSCADGHYIWVEDRMQRLPDAREESLVIIGGCTDITQRKHAEAALLEREEQLRLYAEHCPAAVAMFDCAMHYLVASRNWLEDYQLGGASIIGRSHYEVFPDIPQRWIEAHRRCLAGAVERSEEDLFSRADGSSVWLRWELRPWRKADGQIGGLMMFTEDITARKLVDEKIKLQLAELQRWQSVMLGREDRVLALKEEVNALLAGQKLPPRYLLDPAS